MVFYLIFLLGSMTLKVKRAHEKWSVGQVDAAEEMILVWETWKELATSPRAQEEWIWPVSGDLISAKMWRKGRKCEIKYEGISWLRIRSTMCHLPISQKFIQKRLWSDHCDFSY